MYTIIHVDARWSIFTFYLPFDLCEATLITLGRDDIDRTLGHTELYIQTSLLDSDAKHIGEPDDENNAHNSNFCCAEFRRLSIA